MRRGRKDRSLRTLLRSMGVRTRRTGTGDRFEAIAAPADAGPRDLVFLLPSNPDPMGSLLATKARLAVIPPGAKGLDPATLRRKGKTIVRVAQPRLVMARLLTLLNPGEDAFVPGIHPTAVVSGRARVHRSASVGPYAVVGECRIGAGSRIGSHTVIGDRTLIGKRVIIREHCVIGGPGFGMVRDERTGRVTRMPHVGRAVLEDDVEVFPFVNVDRGTLKETRVCRGAKIDHFAHVGHNCRVEAHALITAGSVLCGKSQVGSRAWIGVGTIVKEGVRVGQRALTGLGAVVLVDVPDDAVVAGVPAKSLRRG